MRLSNLWTRVSPSNQNDHARTAAPLWHWLPRARDEGEGRRPVLLDAEAMGLDRGCSIRELCSYAGWVSGCRGWGLVSVSALSFHTQPVS